MYKYIYIPGTQMTSIFEGQPPKTRPKLQSKQGSVGFQVYICNSALISSSLNHVCCLSIPLYLYMCAYNTRMCIDVYLTKLKKYMFINTKNTHLFQSGVFASWRFQPI